MSIINEVLDAKRTFETDHRLSSWLFIPHSRAEEWVDALCEMPFAVGDRIYGMRVQYAPFKNIEIG